MLLDFVQYTQEVGCGVLVRRDASTDKFESPEQSRCAKPTRALASHQVATQSVKMGGERHWHAIPLAAQRVAPACREGRRRQTLQSWWCGQVAAVDVVLRPLWFVVAFRTGQLRQIPGTRKTSACLHSSVRQDDSRAWPEWFVVIISCAPDAQTPDSASTFHCLRVTIWT